MTMPLDSRLGVRRLVSGILLVLLVGFAVACGNDGDTDAEGGGATKSREVTVRLDFTVNGKHAPFFLGLEKGFYKDEGLEVELLEGRGSLAAVQLVVAQTNTFAFADQSAVTNVVAAGAPVKTVAIFQQQTPVAAVSFDPLNVPEDLYGKRIGLNPLGVGTLWSAFQARNDLDASQYEVISLDGPALLPALLDGRLDATIGLVNAEGSAAEVLADKEVHLLRFSTFEANALAHGLVVHESTMEDDPDLVRRFVAASVRSWEYVLDHKEEAVEAVMDHFPEADQEIITRQLDLSLELMHTEATTGQPLGFMADEDWAATLDLFEEFGGLVTDLPASAFYTNEFLPSE